MWTVRLRERRPLGNHCPASEEQNWNLIPGLLIRGLCPLHWAAHVISCLWEGVVVTVPESDIELNAFQSLDHQRRNYLEKWYKKIASWQITGVQGQSLCTFSRSQDAFSGQSGHCLPYQIPLRCRTMFIIFRSSIT